MSNEEYLKTVGVMVRRLREEKGLSQEQLAARAKCHYKTIGRIENGASVVRAAHLSDTVYALGYTLAKFDEMVRGGNMQMFESDFSRLWDAGFARKYDEMNKLLTELKSKPYCNMGNPAIKQAILMAESTIAYRVENDLQKNLSKLYEALKITLPKLVSKSDSILHKKIPEFPLNMNECMILNSLAISEELNGNIKASISISTELIEVLKKDTTQYSIRKKLFPCLCYNLSTTLIDCKSHAKALTYIEDGITFCCKVKDNTFLGRLLYNKGKSLFFIKDKTGAEKYFQQSLDAFKMENDEYYIAYIKKTVLENYKIELT